MKVGDRLRHAARIGVATALVAVMPPSGAAMAQGAPTAPVVCGVLGNAQVTAAQCYQAMVQDFVTRAMAHSRDYQQQVAQFDARRAALRQECLVIHQFAAEIGIDVGTLPPC